MAKYNLTTGVAIERDDGTFIPPDPANSAYREYQAWLALGNTPDPVPLDTLKAAKLEQVKVWRDAAISKGMSFKGATFWSDKDSITDVMQALSALDAVAALPSETRAMLPATPSTVTWKAWSGTEDNVVHVDLTQDELRLLLAQLSLNTETKFGIEAKLIASVKAASSSEELDAVIWPE